MDRRRRSLDRDQEPLLDSDAVELDNRFAIDDSLAEEQPAADASSPKYPPLPPSYDDTIRVDARSRSKWNPAEWLTLSRTTKEHIQACLPRTSSGDLLTWNTAFSGCFRGAMRCWPSNRFAQASFFIIALWILVLFTGPSLTQTGSDNIGAGLHQDWDYSHIPTTKPAPLHEDGLIVQQAKWQWHNCASIKGTNRVQCMETSSFLLNPNKAKDSFASTESIFVDVDPLRDDRPQPAGSVPGSITVVHQTAHVSAAEKDLLKVEVTARYDEAYKNLFETSLVAKMKRGLYDEGLEILTYAKAVAADQSPLIYDVKLILPPHINIPTLSIDAGASNIDLFQSDPDGKRRLASRGLNRGDAAPARPDFYFGKLHARTQVGKLHSSSIRAIADIHLTTVNGKLHVGGSFEAQSVELKSVNGHLDIDQDSKLEAAYDLSLQTQNGHIRVGQHTNLRATTLRSESLNGGIIAEGAVFNVNHTLSLRSSTGRIEAAIKIEKPDLQRLDAPGLGKTELVKVEAQSQTGSIQLDFLEHQREVPLGCIATSEVASVSVSLHPEYQGEWEIRGATHSRYRGNGTKDGIKTDRGVHRFAIDEDSFGWINRLTRGRTWWESDNKAGLIPKGAVVSVGTQVGLAILTFK
ncbi:hypothetical protein NDA11_005860 [Ustilago hordei]|uniref:Adhesin domain-containing protein n=1 Tax=Ustilago hordei TaxID=120017 RepID=I2FQK9_USTHO|nr:uncharacterized protein UHO2_05228 [Ustilago hordei]KAJ1042889.1 hypothetical protein NDA10_002368 [Ustilago hordei]KAJ1571175.1 hypothetical protein NDA12_001765 [Ustilago hordei]KAJ1571598.1 hypothetical protein NDA15_007418 [Ustilago hordei]KAJ1596122.1 hypothetical protein NDA11_005860 [Ustilago hordei]KAJ1596662.1 hypothetical protein NDA14_003479 [Ustilago hordei]